ncbi:energy-coupling factor transporter transmembrane component T [Halalkalibacter sp. APA_J-10(15)]|uniref:energy-coupling factor transporter transmembrane component T n=1 Tax=Halalkalibacter sp. APA_J-10(15) TaxID=2933805 RepID=UPI001FF15482|nr:energy-coupling factor transporter transmembrane component T [Halalkalibacter sp. APA_J-10(15)]MCK0470573.1 energy-coupling factor transporter transmembrane protein EcfT [Halalkalibacter sp. APA_J-10(15)]
MNAVIHSIHPFVNFLYYFCVGCAMMFFSHPLFLGTAILLLCLLNIVHGNKTVLSKYVFYLMFMGLIVILLNPIFVRRGSTILFYFRHNPITLESIVYGLVMALLLIGILILFLSFHQVLNGRKFMFLFRKVWPQLGLLLMLTIRFVPLFIRRWKEIYDTQKVRQYSMTEGSIKVRAQRGMLYMQKLLTWSLEEALQSAESMKARGYGTSKRSVYHLYHLTIRDLGMIVFLLSLTGIAIVGAQQGYGVLTIYPELESWTFTLLDWTYFVVFILLVSFPILLEGGEHVRWRLLK